MNSYEKCFKDLRKKNEKALIGFVSLGDPDTQSSIEIIKKMSESGVDILELGIPFSDPLADGATIQAANVRALSKGMDTDKAFYILKKVREFTDKPIGLLVYYNIILQRGIDRFYSECKGAGIDSVLSADIPIEESSEVLETAKRHNVNQIFIISELTPDERLEKILSNSSEFVYAVSSLGVTGQRTDLKYSTIELVKRIKKKTNLPVCVGFGISTPEHVLKVCDGGADGAIVGSAIVKRIEDNLEDKGKMLEEIGSFVSELKNATLG